MKTLIHNYSSGLSTEPMYFNQCLTECGVESHLWGDPNVSAFDMFDAINPEIFISHYRFLTNDIIKYIRQNNKIEMILNTTGASEQELQTLEEMYDHENIKTPFIFTNLYDFMYKFKPKKIKMVNIIPAADIFLQPVPSPSFEIDLAIVSTDNNNIIQEIKQEQDVYHLLSLGKENKSFDLAVDIRTITGLYERYKELMLIDDIAIVSSQILFDASQKAKKVSVRVNNSQQEILDKVLAMLFHAENDSQDVGEMIRQQIKRKHTCLNRTARLTRLLKNEEASKQLQSMSEKL